MVEELERIDFSMIADRQEYDYSTREVDTIYGPPMWSAWQGDEDFDYQGEEDGYRPCMPYSLDDNADEAIDNMLDLLEKRITEQIGREYGRTAVSGT